MSISCVVIIILDIIYVSVKVSIKKVRKRREERRLQVWNYGSAEAWQKKKFIKLHKQFLQIIEKKIDFPKNDGISVITFLNIN